ncbi:MAG TPA: hypothetical protein VE152_03425 [Acidimicrobiales bacterium]|nr:hypothetical protein [Acidimicrobiales bacterium]
MIDDDKVAVSVGTLLDDVGTVLLGVGRADRPRRLVVSDEMFTAILAARREEIARGNPLMLLDLDVVADATLAGNESLME